MKPLSEDDFRGAAESIVCGDRAKAATQLAGVLVTAATGHSVLGGLAAGAVKLLAEALGNSAEKRMVEAEAKWDDDQARTTALQKALLLSSQPLLMQQGESFALLSDEMRRQHSRVLELLQSSLEDRRRGQISVDEHLRSITNALGEIRRALSDVQDKQGLVKITVEVCDDARVPVQILNDTLECLLTGKDVEVRVALGNGLSVLYRNVQHAFAHTHDRSAEGILRSIDETLAELGYELPELLRQGLFWRSRHGIEQNEIAVICSLYAQLRISQEVMSMSMRQLSGMGLPIFDRFAVACCENVPEMLKLVALQQRLSLTEVLAYEIPQSHQRIYAPARLGGQWLYLTCPSDEGENLARTVHEFVLRYVAPQTVFWNRARIGKEPMRLPQMDSRFAAGAAYDSKGDPVQLDYDELHRRLKARARG